MSRIDRAFGLFGSSWAVVRQDRELLLLPLISGVVNLVALGSFAVPGWLSLHDAVAYDAAGDASSTLAPTAMTYTVGVLAYLSCAFVVAFFNAALVVAANDRFEGRDPTLGSALAGAWRRVGSIMLWAVLAATVAMALSQVRERLGPISKLFGWLLGHAWAFMSFLVLPALVIDGVGVGAALHRSTDAVRTTWGENAAGRVSLWLVGVLVGPLVVIVGVAGVVTLDSSFALGVALLVVAAAALLAFAIVTSAMGVIYQTALFRYATGRPIAGYDEHDLAGTFRPLQLSRFAR